MRRRDVYVKRDTREIIDVRVILFVAVIIMITAIAVWFWVSVDRYETGYSEGYTQACADVRHAVAVRVNEERPFIIRDIGMGFKRVGHHMFSIRFFDLEQDVPSRPGIMAQAQK
jgi:hypothetical protein